MLGQTAEIIDKGQTFAERFGWEALVIVVVLVFVGFLIWRVGGRMASAIASFLEVSIAQLGTQAETQAKTSEAISLLSNSAATTADCQHRIEQMASLTHDKVEKVLKGVLGAARVAYDMIPDTEREAKTKLLRVIQDLEN